MAQRPDIQLHANVNTHGNDASLRVTLTAYAADGTPEEPRTWRMHHTACWLDGEADTAIHLLLLLAKMIVHQEKLEGGVTMLDRPLF